MRLLDLFCGAGGAGMGYHRAGFEVVGVDLHPQPNYPFEFHQADALTFDLGGFDAIHASPPCQAHTTLKARWRDREHADHVEATRNRLVASGVPYVIENVPGAPLLEPSTLCGSMFDLPIKRHRLFESSFPLVMPGCDHGRWKVLWPEGFHRDVSKARVAAGAPTRSPVVTVTGNGGGPGKVLSTWQWAMDTPWMLRKVEVAQSIPPAYTEHIGAQLMAHLS